MEHFKIVAISKVRKMAIIFSGIGIILFCFAGRLRSTPTFILSFLFLFVAVPMLVIIVNVISFHTKSLGHRLFSLLIIFVLIMVALIGSRIVIVESLPYLYTSPAITKENLPAYNKFIRFAKNCNSDRTLVVGKGCRVVVNGTFYMLVKNNSFEWERARKELSEEVVNELKVLCEQLHCVRCAMVKRVNDMLLFFNVSNVSLPGFSSFLPVSTNPGVLYSLNGEEPNEINDEVLNAFKPFVRITGNWYMSRKLMLAGPRANIPASIPKSLIDHSLKVDGIDPNELHKFD